MLYTKIWCTRLHFLHIIWGGVYNPECQAMHHHFTTYYIFHKNVQVIKNQNLVYQIALFTHYLGGVSAEAELPSFSKHCTYI